MTNIPFKTEQLKAGDAITMSRYGSEGLNEEVQRLLIVDAAPDLVRVIVLLDALGRGWTGKLLSFAKIEIDADKWRLLC